MGLLLQLVLFLAKKTWGVLEASFYSGPEFDEKNPSTLARLLLLLLFADLMNLTMHSAFFDIRHSLGVKSCWILESPTPGSSQRGRLPIFL